MTGAYCNIEYLKSGCQYLLINSKTRFLVFVLFLFYSYCNVCQFTDKNVQFIYRMFDTRLFQFSVMNLLAIQEFSRIGFIIPGIVIQLIYSLSDLLILTRIHKSITCHTNIGFMENSRKLLTMQYSSFFRIKISGGFVSFMLHELSPTIRQRVCPNSPEHKIYT